MPGCSVDVGAETQHKATPNTLLSTSPENASSAPRKHTCATPSAATTRKTIFPYSMPLTITVTATTNFQLSHCSLSNNNPFDVEPCNHARHDHPSQLGIIEACLTSPRLLAPTPAVLPPAPQTRYTARLCETLGDRRCSIALSTEFEKDFDQYSVLEGKQDVVYRPEKNTVTETRLDPVNVTRMIPADESLVLNAAVENTISRYGLSPAWPSSSTINISNHNQGTSLARARQPEHTEFGICPHVEPKTDDDVARDHGDLNAPGSGWSLTLSIV
jgi:hypothetical protein